MKNPSEIKIPKNPFCFIDQYETDHLLALARHYIGVSLFGDIIISFDNGHEPRKAELESIAKLVHDVHRIELREAVQKILEITATLHRYKEMEAATYKYQKTIKSCIADIMSARIDEFDYIEAFHILAVNILYMYQHIDTVKYYDLHKIFVKPALQIVEYYALYIRYKKQDKDLFD